MACLKRTIDTGQSQTSEKSARVPHEVRMARFLFSPSTGHLGQITVSLTRKVFSYLPLSSFPHDMTPKERPKPKNRSERIEPGNHRHFFHPHAHRHEAHTLTTQASAAEVHPHVVGGRGGEVLDQINFLQVLTLHLTSLFNY